MVKKLILFLFQIFSVPLLFIVSYVVLVLPLGLLPGTHNAGALALVILMLPVVLLLAYVLNRVIVFRLAKFWQIEVSIVGEIIVTLLYALPFFYLALSGSLISSGLALIILSSMVMWGRRRDKKLRNKGLIVIFTVIILYLLMLVALIPFLQKRFRYNLETKQALNSMKAQVEEQSFQINDVYLVKRLNRYDAVLNISASKPAKVSVYVNACRHNDPSLIQKVISQLPFNKDSNICLQKPNTLLLTGKDLARPFQLNKGNNQYVVQLNWDDDAVKSGLNIQNTDLLSVDLFVILSNKTTGGSTVTSTPLITSYQGFVRIESE